MTPPGAALQTPLKRPFPNFPPEFAKSGSLQCFGRQVFMEERASGVLRSMPLMDCGRRMPPEAALRPGFSGAYWRAQDIPACNVRLVNPQFRFLSGNGRKRMASGAAAASNCGIRAGMGSYKSQARRAAGAFPDISALKFSRVFRGIAERFCELSGGFSSVNFRRIRFRIFICRGLSGAGSVGIFACKAL